MARVRLGVVLLLPDPVKTEINGLRRALGDDSLDRIDPHITLVPPINIRVEDLGDAIGIVRRAAARCAEPFDVTLGPVETFAPQTPVIKLGVYGDTASLRELRDDIFVLPFARELTWPFAPHVTLRDDASDLQLENAASLLDAYEMDVTIAAVHVLQESEGRVWTPIAHVELDQPTVIGVGGLSTELSTTTIIDPVVAAQFESDTNAIDLAVVARRDGQCVGVVAGTRDGNELELRLLRVVEGQQGEGIGSHLVRRMLFVAAEEGCSIVVNGLDVTFRTFLERSGFRDDRYYLG